MFQDGKRRFFLLVRQIAVLAEYAFDQHPQVRPHVFAHCPVDRDVFPDRYDQLAGYGAEYLVAQNLDRAVVRLQRVVEGELGLGTVDEDDLCKAMY